MRIWTKRVAAAVMMMAAAASVAAAEQAERTPAFPGAEGFGRYASGGRGGQVLFVENLNDSGAGSLRAAVETQGARTIIFRVSGTIELEKGLLIREPDITIAGQTAPGDGICLANYEFYLRANNAIVRHIRVRPGKSRPGERDAMTIRNLENAIIDHCSASWAIDEVLSTTHAKDVTVQYCLITQALHDAGHHKGDHGFGGLISGERISYHHNLYAHNRSRNPRPASGFIDFRNNVIYNWNREAGYAGTINKQRLNYIANYLKPGPSTETGRYLAFHTGGPETFVYTSGNVLEGILAEGQDDLAIMNVRDGANMIERPFEVIAPPTESATEAYERVLAGAGATLPKRDAADQKVIDDVRNGTGEMIDDPAQAGGWPELTSAAPPADGDSDGMPDAFEQQHKLDPHNPEDRNADPDGDGYTNLEEHLNHTDPHVTD